MIERREIVDAMLVNSVTHKKQHVDVTVDSVNRVLGCGGLLEAQARGVTLQLGQKYNVEDVMPFQDALVPLLPSVQNRPESKN